MICVVLFCFPGLNASRAGCGKWILGVILILAGCAGPEIHRAEVITVVIQPVHEQIDTSGKPFVLTGRLVVNAKQQKFSGGIRWRHTRQRDEIYLFSPLGQVVAEILQDQTGVRLTTSEPAIYQAQSAEYLTNQVLGWELPLAGLQFWVRGEHYPGTIAEKDLNRNNRTVAIRQDGWNIAYQSYYPEQPTVPALPRLLEFSRMDVKMKLIVDQWEKEAKGVTGVDRKLP
ncbi:outer membrane lipoprotein LolB [Nitrosomonas eutropha C91]|uniref:Outer-membrane lipoprotein LolB n=1 Tax=Nitrosomonas eutropha (strain DSM 101675 / C91 / Nm57) TaxID=335283 RepID=Q0AGY9_NITEC|nr:outer membrane lipoprotein LolB [Nitrosomonas eutropha C91]MXS79435.1 outer membrane lipoprotein LolB [Nitrosomonas sp. GH22]